MTPQALEVILNYRKQSLDTCKSLVEEGRLETANVILELLETNIGDLQ